MAMKYDPTAYETWRQNFELRQSLAWFAGFAWYLIWGGGISLEQREQLLAALSPAPAWGSTNLGQQPDDFT